MQFDLRLPIGILFCIYGLLLAIYGLITKGSEMYQHSMGININLIWGLVMLVFGAIMLAFALRRRK